MSANSGRCLRRLAAIMLGAGLMASAWPASAPPWLLAISKQPAATDYGKANTAILLDEAVIDVDSAGVFTTRTRRVVKLLTPEGKTEAGAEVPYDSGSEKVKSFQAWLVQPAGPVTTYGRKDCIDLAVYANARELYGEARRLALPAESDAEVGSVFAYEAVIENRSTDSQRDWTFQFDRPVEKSSLTINLPADWTVRTRTFNHEALVPVTSGRSLTWELLR